MIPLWRTAILLVLLLLLLASPALARFSPEWRWQRLESEHFIILFHDECAALASQAARYAEEAHRLLAPRLNWTPAEKTFLVLADDGDLSNGYATPYPANRIVISPLVALDEPFSLTDRETWLRLVILHEYVHTLHLDTTSGLPGFLRALFGRVYFPQGFQPEWLIEGMATHLETSYSEGGRGRGSYAAMLRRMAILEGKLPELAQLGVAPTAWPAGEVPYLFGESFYRYLVDRYGDGVTAPLSADYAGRALPLRVDASATKVLGTTYADLWNDWRRGLQQGVAIEKDAIEAVGTTPFVLLTEVGERQLYPSPSPDGRWLAYASRTLDALPTLRLRDLETGEERDLVRYLAQSGNAGFSWSGDGRQLYYSRLERDGNDNLYSDLYRYDLEQNEEIRLSHHLRSGRPDLSPDGTTLLFPSAQAGETTLLLFSLADQTVRPYPLEAPLPLPFMPRWSPDGSKIVVGSKDADGRFSLIVLDLAGRLLRRIQLEEAIVASPVWSRDGESLYFVADRDGVFNLYACSLADGAIVQLSNLLGGAFSPVPDATGERLFFSSYSARGFDIARFSLSDSLGRPVLSTTESGEEPAPVQERPALILEPSAPYQPWRDILPHAWMPWLGTDEYGLQVGIALSGSDPLAQHQWSAATGWGSESERAAYSASYRYQGWRPLLDLQAEESARFYDDFYLPQSPTPRNLWERRRRFGLDLTWVGAGLWGHQEISLGGRYERLTPLTAPPAGAISAFEGTLAGLQLLWRYDESAKAPAAVAPEDGRRLELALRHDAPGLGSDLETTRLRFDWREYLALPWRHQLLTPRLFFGRSWGDSLPQGAFQLGGDLTGDLPLLTEETLLPLRGYPLNSLRGERALLTSLEYRFPLYFLDRGHHNGSFYSRQLHGALFAEGGEVFDRGGPSMDGYRTSAGAELRFDLDLAYRLPLTVRVVYAKGFDAGGEKQGYFSFWFRF
ncbi:MAG: hypothetical protein C0621_10465 [Desulfuromonas sp.]|nr:MAG: hypothetical protein C0621_10465 [Desulfuromonas sp.]